MVFVFHSKATKNVNFHPILETGTRVIARKRYPTPNRPAPAHSARTLLGASRSRSLFSACVAANVNVNVHVNVKYECEWEI